MNTERTEKFVNAIACDLEEGGFRQVSGTTLRRTLATAVSAALPLLTDTGIPASQPAELAEQQGVDAVDDQLLDELRDVEDYFNDVDPNPIHLATVQAAISALAATGKQQVGEAMDREQLGDLVEGMAVSVDVDGLFSTDGRRLFGTITAVQHEDGEKGGLMLLVQEPEPNWKPEQVGEVQGDALSLADHITDHLCHHEYDIGGRSELLACVIEALAARQPGAPNGKLVGWWNGITPGYDGQGDWSIRWGADAENSRHDIPLYDGFNPIHYQQPAHGIALGRLRSQVLGLTRRVEPISGQRFSYVQLDDVLALIDQRDAAPGAGNG